MDSSLSADEGVYGSSDISSDQTQQQQQFGIPAPSRGSLPYSQHYQDSLKRFEQMYSLLESSSPPMDLDMSAFTSDSLYV